jgi:hypothetical protein
MSLSILKKRALLLLFALSCAQPFLAQQNPPDNLPQSASSPPASKATEIWRYNHVEGIGDDIKIHFEYKPEYNDYVLSASDRQLLLQASQTSESGLFPRPRAIKFQDLEAMVVAHIVRNQVRINAQTQFTPLTGATTLLKVFIQIHSEASSCKSQDVIAYPLFVRAINNSGRVIQTSEFTVNMPAHDGLKSDGTASARVDIPLTPGKYDLAIATKNPTTGAAGVIRTQLDVPTSESLGMKD